MSEVHYYTCDCCGKVFFQEYYDNGYINHRNFSSNLDVTSKDYNRLINAITKDGNKIIDKDRAVDRFNCFIAYCQKNECNLQLNVVKDKMINHIKHLMYLDSIRDNILEIVGDLNEFEKEYVGLK